MVKKETETINANISPQLADDDNYVTDAQKLVLENTSGINTGDVDFPLKPWQKMLFNVFIVSSITGLSIISTGGMNDMEVWKAAFLAGAMTFLVQVKILIEKDLRDDDKGVSYTPLMFVK